MALTIPRNYAAGSTLRKIHLDAAFDAVETLLNTTLLDSSYLAINAVTTIKINNGAVDENKLAASVAGSGLTGGAGSALAVNVDNSTLEVNTDIVRIKDGGVTKAKLTAVGQQVASSSGNQSTTSTTWIDVTNQSVTITTAGRPVILFVQSAGGGNNGALSTTNGTSSNAPSSEFRILRDSSVSVGNWKISINANFTGQSLQVPAALVAFDPVAAGTYTYKFQMQSITNVVASTTSLSNVILGAYEL